MNPHHPERESLILEILASQIANDHGEGHTMQECPSRHRRSGPRALGALKQCLPILGVQAGAMLGLRCNWGIKQPGRAGGGRVFLPNTMHCGEAKVVMWPGSGPFQGREGIRWAVWGRLGWWDCGRCGVSGLSG